MVPLVPSAWGGPWTAGWRKTLLASWFRLAFTDWLADWNPQAGWASLAQNG
jgi:hypothetical protein